MIHLHLLSEGIPGTRMYHVPGITCCPLGTAVMSTAATKYVGQRHRYVRTDLDTLLHGRREGRGEGMHNDTLNNELSLLLICICPLPAEIRVRYMHSLLFVLTAVVCGLSQQVRPNYACLSELENVGAALEVVRSGSACVIIP